MAKKTPAKTASPKSSAKPKEPRILKKPSYSSFRLQKRITPTAPPVPGSLRLLKASLGILFRNWKLFGGMVLIYGVLQMLLVQGFGASGTVGQVKENAELLVQGNIGHLAAGLTSFGYLLSSSGAGGAYQSFIVLLTSLALIWTLRQVHEGEHPRIRDGFYYGSYPLVQFVLVLTVIALQVLPAVIATTIYGYAVNGGIIAGNIEHILWLLMVFAFILLTLYMLSSSLFALYIVTLPDMTPLRALRTARELVRYRRWTVMRRIIFLPVALVLLAGLLIVPLIIFVTPAASWAFLLLSLFGLAAIHSYMYRLFKGLLG